MYLNKEIGNTVVEVDLDRLAHNLKVMLGYAGEGVGLIAVVKANAYGHGFLGVCQTLIENGATYLAVASIPEAMQIRQKFPDYPLLIFGHTPDFSLPLVVENNIAQDIFTLRQAIVLNDLAEKAGKKATIHIKIETGMNRLGFSATKESIEEIMQICSLPNIYVEGIFSHFTLISHEVHQQQFDKFTNLTDALEARGAVFKYKHMADSVTAIEEPEFNLNMIRVGIHLYGVNMLADPSFPFDIHQVMTFRTRVAFVHPISKGDGVSYQHMWKAERDSMIATLAFGYADGYSRMFLGKGYVTIRGQKAPIVGHICMDQCMADVTDIPGVEEGDIAVIFGTGYNQMSLLDAGKALGVNPATIMAGLTARPERIYFKE
ncbi:MAG: alanine racemase [Clostridia bacterium]|nr:alanine racemase [Clostridia bacterium]